MKQLLTLALISIISVGVNATHNQGGVITYRHITGKTFEATITTYTRSGSPANRNQLILDWGDNTTASLQKDTSFQINNSTQKNIYKGTHLYTSNGVYILRVTDPNRNAGIINIPQSVSVPFVIMSELIVGTALPNNSVVFPTPPPMEIELGKLFSFNPSAFDPDGDILSFELVEPLSNNGPIAGSIPTGATINLINGELNWVPNNVGQYVFAIKISSCRNNYNLDFVILDFQVNVVPPTVDQRFAGLTNWPLDLNGRFSKTVRPGDSVHLSIAFDDSKTNMVSLSGWGEGFRVLDSALLKLDSSALGYVRKNFKWKPSASQLRCAPYIFTFKGTSTTQTHTIEKDITLMIYVQDSSFDFCDSVCSQPLYLETEKPMPTAMLEVFPNPFSNNVSFIFLKPEANVSYTFVLYDAKGQQVRHRSNIVGGNFSVQRGSLPSGIYFYHISGADKTEFTGQIIISD